MTRWIFFSVPAWLSVILPRLSFTHAKLSTHDDAKLQDGSEYWSLAGALQYLTLTRPDLALHTSTGSVQSLTAYSDADWAGCSNSRRSTSGFCVYLSDNLVSWSSKRQTMASHCNAEAEYHVVAHAVEQLAKVQKKGLFKLDREKDQLTVVIGTAEHFGRV
ncbi:uncharacterized protein LOC106804275 [Setaria italica]|uniref:uncharacterized protein LOC106804275 n=1 Tax=Setaria italica TaxID=4555 RepID=UPI0007199E72|nr:uncharacterized protein LOC106804275 [Setaria italica]